MTNYPLLKTSGTLSKNNRNYLKLTESAALITVTDVKRTSRRQKIDIKITVQIC